MNKQGKSNGNTSINLLINLLPVLLLYSMVLFGFFIHQQLSCEYQFLYPTTFLATYIFFIYLTPKLLQRTNISTAIKPFVVIGFLLANTVSLYFLSSINRESEIRNYIQKNENNLKSFITQYQIYRDDKIVPVLEKDLNICSFFVHNGDYYFKLYTFLGYGYGLIYTDKSELAIPQTSPGGSPIVNWIKIDEHWYYYSYFD